MPEAITCSGLVTLAGRPNVGKSTLLNRLIGQKISVTSSKAQTTRHRLLGIKTTRQAQIIYVDTPGLHAHNKGLFNRHLNRVAASSLLGVDCIVLLITSNGWNEADEFPLRLVSEAGVPVILAINKIDQLKDRRQLLPLIALSNQKMAFKEIVPLSATTGENTHELENIILKLLPEQPPLYPVDRISDRSERFLAAELIREQIFRGFQQEVPYATAVSIDQFERIKKTLHVQATIWVERDGQKPILIGKDGRRLKTVGSRARQTMEKLFDNKVHLRLWVKVREGWSDNET
jgi:GTP-binding protein Era